MDEKTVSSTAEQTKNSVLKNTAVQQVEPSAEIAGSERRQAYGTAKTENLRDSGLWRLLLPAVVIICCVALFVIPLIILIPLLFNSISAIGTSHTQEAQLLWVWVTMIVIEMLLFAVIARGILKAFLTQAGNYRA
ncbi:hypothetical protein [Dictyobacter arantiisoli]|uniref:Uncharacterized protein n=1 Tax=Dictyobacter arantiisoli TaxID=2014874 RepID=A0A5A5TBT1_9CHLR|nr:hypothetical protein [Dictyobacter arantiisoli]GCF08606.1 hypothetical protein KDI_21700 [Dictyobacter arantiisoli]